MKQDQKNTDSGVTTLRSKFCDGNEGKLVTAAQAAATRECQYPQQSPVQQHEKFEPFGNN